LAAAEKKATEKAKDAEMTDLDMIKENMTDIAGKVIILIRPRDVCTD
jgi:hypothetical protein